ncbi:DUF6000 family protein [Actinopolymorpha pittospori]|uniref:Uncharacterized protein n=1 Tax=Actinopolymorpha pittospori TaxID=648752 RepID=A0A927MS64_9ACTN|nr:DUF6000 family protein [Actinopolymorpha pittospori]MBE1605679.1 hypothetical protein [Actinopolymorpha pittospori]
MSVRMPDGYASLPLIQRYVVWTVDRPGGQRYLRLLGSALREDVPDRDAFERALAEDAREVTDEDLGELLEFEWRGRLTAAWLIGLDQRTQFRRAIGRLLLASELAYAGQGYCFALARFGRPEDAEILVAYLDKYLQRTDCHCDQDRAIGALLHIDNKLGTNHANRFLARSGVWGQSAFANRDPLECRDRMAELCSFADRLMSGR